MAYVLSVLGCCNLESVVGIDYFCSDHLSRILAHYLSCCECPTDLSLYSALVSYINAIFFSLFSLCFRCTLLEHIFHSRVASICLLQYSIYTLLHITTTTHPLTSRTTMSPTDEISTNDKQFIIECLKSLDEDRLINLNKVAETLGYSNVFSAGNRLRSLRNRYGFSNFEGKTITGKAVAGEGAGIPAPAPAPERKRGRPRVKNVAPKGHVAVEVTNKRKRDDDNNTNNNNNNNNNNEENEENNEENNGDVPKKPTRRRRKPASTTTTTTAESEATTNGHGHVNGSAGGDDSNAQEAAGDAQ